MSSPSILCDLGNSQLKWCLSTQLADIFILSHDDILTKKTQPFTKALTQANMLVIASVANPKILNALLHYITHFTSINIQQLSSQARQAGVINAYQQPETLGVDRWMTLLAAHKKYPHQDILIIDCGSAVTADLLKSSGQHLGGCIIPGLTNMKECLWEKTSLTKTDTVAKSTGFVGQNTQDCIQLGALTSIIGLIHILKNHYESELQRAVKVILTGKDAYNIKTKIALPCVIEDNLVMQGMVLAMTNKHI